MRLARKRAIDRRPPFQVGFGITLSVFLALMGLILFERIILLVSLIGFGYQASMEMPNFVYGEIGVMGPWDWMAVALAGLFIAQVFRAWHAWRDKQTSRVGIVLGLCNFAVMGLLSFGLLINWAYYNPQKIGADPINRLGGILSSDFEQPSSSFYDPYPEEDGWEKIDEHTHRHEEMGLIVREEIIKYGFPVEMQQLNYQARHQGEQDPWIDEGIRAKHYYDLDGNLITIMAHDRWATVKQRLEAANRPAQDWDNAVSDRYRLLLAEKQNAKRSGERETPYTYEEILEMVVDSWDGIEIEE